MPEVVAFEDVTGFRGGWYPNIPISGNNDSLDVALEGANVLFSGLGQPRTWEGCQSVGSPAPMFLQLIGDSLGGLASGSVVMYKGRSLWFVGSGSVYYNNLATPIGTATSNLKVYYSGVEYNAGMSTPSTPTVAVAVDGSSVPLIGNINNSVGVRITRYRSATGGESSASEASAVVTPKTGQITITFPSLDSGNSQDQWGIYLTRQGFGSEGPHFLWDVIDDTDLNGSREYNLDFQDADLLDILAPRNLITPPAATHVINLGDMIVLIGTENGVAVLPSLQGYPEQFDQTLTAYLQPTEPVIRVDTRPADGQVYIWTRNSLQTIVETGDSVAPILTRAIWPNTGIQGQSAACLTETGAYAFSGRQGMVRTSGYADPDTSFALPVQNYVKDWNAEDVVVGYDPASSTIVYCHQREILAYNQSNNLWSTPLVVTNFLESNALQSRIISAATYNGELYLTIGDETTNKLYKYGVGVGTEWYAKSLHKSAGAYGWYKWLRAIRLNANFTTRVYGKPIVVSNSVNLVTDGYVASGADGTFYLEQTIPADQNTNNLPYIEFETATSTSAGYTRLLIAPAGNTYAVRDATTATSGAFYVDVLANGSVSVNGVSVLASSTVAAGYKVRVHRTTGATKWRISIYNTSGTVTTTYSFNSPTDITGSSIGFKFYLQAGVSLYKHIKNVYLSGSPDSETTLSIYTKYGTIAADSKAYSQNAATVYDWWKLNIKDAPTYQIGLSGKGAGQTPYSMNLVGIVRPIMS